MYSSPLLILHVNNCFLDAVHPSVVCPGVRCPLTHIPRDATSLSKFLYGILYTSLFTIMVASEKNRKTDRTET